MPNHCYNELHIWGPKAELRRFIEENSIEDPEGSRLTFRKAVPPPDERILDTMEGFNGKIPGLPSGYAWSNENWGTKWDAYDQTPWVFDKDYYSDDFEDGEHACMSFYTAWSPPEPVVEAWILKYPMLVISLHFEEAGVQFMGEIEGEEGKMTHNESRTNLSRYECMNLRGG